MGIILDQITKHIADKMVSPINPIIIIPKWLHLQLVYNTGAAYGILQHQRAILLGISGLVIGVCLILYQKLAHNPITKLALSFLLIGAVGNLIDRVILGYVIDFIATPFFPVFNLSDVSIDIGIGLFLLDLWQTRHHNNDC